MSEFFFEEQYNTFNALGYAANPNSSIGGLIGDSDSSSTHKG
jgi:hypothetical protein